MRVLKHARARPMVRTILRPIEFSWWRTREGISFFGAAEAIGLSDQGTVVSARGGIRVAW
jgi:hypothetical protein